VGRHRHRARAATSISTTVAGWTGIRGTSILLPRANDDAAAPNTGSAHAATSVDRQRGWVSWRTVKEIQKAASANASA
jgi:hypothetical protein